jgi:hypothetical protein
VHAPCEDKSDDTKISFYEKLGRFYQFPRNDEDIFLGDFNAKLGREDIFKLTTENKTLHESSNKNRVRVVNFATPKNLALRSTMFPHCNIHKYIWSSPDGKMHNQIDNVLTDRRRHSRILDVQSFRGADCDTHQYLVVAKMRERLAVSKRAAQKTDTERFNLKKLNEGDIKEQYHVTIRNKSAALQNLRGQWGHQQGMGQY